MVQATADEALRRSGELAVTGRAVDVDRADAPPSPPATSAPRPPLGNARAARLLAFAAPSLVFLAVRLVGLVTLAWLADVNDDPLLTRLSVWDGQWLLAIAGGSYEGVPLGLVDAFGHRNPTTPLAFFPGYPAAVAVFRFITSTSLEIAGLTVALLASLVLAHGLARLGELVPGGSRRAGLLLV